MEVLFLKISMVPEAVMRLRAGLFLLVSDVPQMTTHWLDLIHCLSLLPSRVHADNLGPNVDQASLSLKVRLKD